MSADHPSTEVPEVMVRKPQAIQIAPNKARYNGRAVIRLACYAVTGRKISKLERVPETKVAAILADELKRGGAIERLRRTA